MDEGATTDTIFAWISNDGGQGFGAPQKIATPLKSYGGDDLARRLRSPTICGKSKETR